MQAVKDVLMMQVMQSMILTAAVLHVLDSGAHLQALSAGIPVMKKLFMNWIVKVSLQQALLQKIVLALARQAQNMLLTALMNLHAQILIMTALI
jgi:hypothetical protein